MTKSVDAYETILTFDQFAEVIGSGDIQTLRDWYEPSEKAMHIYGIGQTRRRVEYFLATMSFESYHFARMEEDLFYTTPERIVRVWPSRFYFGEPAQGKLDASQYTRNPQHLANTVYANRGGNGNYASGDGWKFRGRGPGHYTFRGQYEAASKRFGVDFVEAPELLALPRWGMLVCAWLWADVKNLNAVADRGDFDATQRAWNGGDTDIDTRRATLAEIQRAMKEMNA